MNSHETSKTSEEAPVGTGETTQSTMPIPKSGAGRHVVFFANYLPIHFLTMMEAMSSLIPRFTVLLSAREESTVRNWRPVFGKLNIRIQKSISWTQTYQHPFGFKQRSLLILPISTFWDLVVLKPDVLVVTEVGARTFQAMLVRLLTRRFALIVQVRESMITALSRGKLRERIRSTLLPFADLVLVNGKSGRDYAISCGVPDGKIRIVPSGTDTENFGKLTRVTRNDGVLRFIYCGRLSPEKGLKSFLKIFLETCAKSSRKVELAIVGTGMEEQALKHLSTQKEIVVNFIGERPYTSLATTYIQHDILVMPSLCDEWGMVVNEAMASGLPVLGCTGSQAVEELVSDQINGWLYPPHDDDALKQSLDAILAISNETLVRMGVEARTRALEVSDRAVAKMMEEITTKVSLPGGRQL